MRVQRVVMPWDAVSWTVLEDDGSPVGTVDRFLGFLSSSEKSPNTVKSQTRVALQRLRELVPEAAASFEGVES